MRVFHRIVVAAFLLLQGCQSAHADIGLLLNAKPNVPWELGTAEITGEGHSAVYLSRVCPASPVKLRLCGPGENGSIIQNYQDYKEDEPYEWNVVPLNIYLYGVKDLRDQPLFGSPEIRKALQEQYRDEYLQPVCSTPTCLSSPAANWRDAVAAAFVREIYVFEVRTTAKQDEEFIRKFNARPNVNHYNGITRNCADFAKLVVNTYFPHSAHRDVLNDFGMTGPKAIARSFSHYAEHHPQLEFHVIRIEQVPGTYKRSSDCREGTEQTFRSMKWLLPMLILGTHEVPVLAASYLLTGRFNPDHEMRSRPSEDSAQLYLQLADAKRSGDHIRERELRQQLQAERNSELGEEQQWQQYRERFEEIVRTAIDDGVIADRGQLHKMFRQLQADGRFYVDGDAEPWLEVQSGEQLRRVGLSAGNLFSTGSDSQLALQIVLARTDSVITAKSRHRELWPEFQSDWALLQQAEEVLAARSSGTVIATRASAP